ncbi:dehydrogenase/reductase SDR family member 7B-like [Tubulanus polymorphus]|uniref:dehydrogenase/reductase SDR family member 7B-like n=1 Tax=Tubulanus polymorphus TaxID=672921 RepID=UPI003DA49108
MHFCCCPCLTTILPASILAIVIYKWMTRKRTSVTGKLVFITGASSGVGKACAFLFHKLGAKVVLAARNIDALMSVKTDLMKKNDMNEPIVVQLDLCDIEQITEVVKKVEDEHGPIDVLVNNAGMSYRGEIIDTDITVHQKLMHVNYFGHVVLTKAVLPAMIKQKSGHIVAVSSVQGKLSIPFRSAYSASKHATQAFFDCLRAEVAHHNIQVSVVSPGYIKTNLSLNAMTGDGSSYAIEDATTASGMEPSVVAESIVDAIERSKYDLILAPIHHRLVVYFRSLFPALVVYIMNLRAAKQFKLKNKS